MTWNHKLRWKTSTASIFSLLIAAFVATFPCLCAGQTYEDDALYIDDPSVSTLSGTVAPAYVEQDSAPDAAYRQLVAGNARYLKEDLPAAQAVPRIASETDQYPIATIVYSPDMPVQPTVLTQTTSRNVYLASIDSGAVSTDDLPAIEYGLVNLQTPLLVVMGHYPSRSVAAMIREYDALKTRAKAESDRISRSGARAIPSGVSSEQMKRYNLVGPAIARTREAYPDLQGYDFSNIVSEALVWQSLETILMKSTTAQDLVRVGKLNVIAAIVDDKTGKIYWLGSHPLQHEFLKPIPQNLAEAKITNEALYEPDLPQALDDAAVQSYVDLYESNPYYNQVVYDYYSDPLYYQPSWELFSQRAWIYRPWYGVWVNSFTPWPYWSPWAPPQNQVGLGVSYWDGGLNFFIGYNRGFGAPVYYDPHFRPRDPWWGRDYYARFDPRAHDPVFALIVDGRRSEIVYGSRTAPWGRPEPGYRPGAVRPGVAITLGALRIAFGDSHRDPAPGGPRRARPGDPTPGRPGGPMAPGARPGGSSSPRPGDPMSPRPGFSGVRPGGAPSSGSRPVQPSPTPGARPGGAPSSGSRPAQPSPTPGARPGGAPSSGARPAQPSPTPGARPGGRVAVESRPAPATTPIANASSKSPAAPQGAPFAGARRAENRAASLPPRVNDASPAARERRAPEFASRADRTDPARRVETAAKEFNNRVERALKPGGGRPSAPKPEARPNAPKTGARPASQPTPPPKKP